MSTIETPALVVPAREVPVPAYLSPEARAVLATEVPGPPSFPALEDRPAWRELVRLQDAQSLAYIGDKLDGLDVVVQEIDAGGTPVYDISPGPIAGCDGPVFLDIHGGGLICGGGVLCRATGIGTSLRLEMRTWSVDYRTPPDHPYPAALDDCVAAYRSLLEERPSREIVIGGSSAGGNLAAALVLRARDEGLPLPAALVLRTPEVDLTESGDSFRTNCGLDTMLPCTLMPANLLYADGHDLRHPYLSPLFADFAPGFPATFLTTGTRDLFLSNTVRMHRALRAAGVAAELHVLDAAPHGGFFDSAPEDLEIYVELRRFIGERVG